MSIMLAAAVIPPLYLLYVIYRMDKIEKEPASLILKLFVFGCVAVVPAALIESYVIEGLAMVVRPATIPFLLIENFLCVALVEELVKYLGLKLGSWRNPAFNYCFDGVVYAVTVSLGFAAAENIGYVASYGISVAVTRALTAIPGHCIFGIFMGYYYGMAKYAASHGDKGRASTYRVLAVVMPMIIHGFYDFCASSGYDLLIRVFFA
ncbi:MAG: PrsW family intramembrane metalloprotease [Mogibacterium sp.]|nr:PrsW family intramembrane metalloprotease [Mogibacterium sp.]